MKRILFILGSAAAVIATLLVLVPLLVPASAVKNELAAYVRETTGRKLAIEGTGRFSVIPSVGVTFEQVRLSGPDGNAETPFLAADTITAELSLLSLVTGSVVFDALDLDGAIIDLRKDPAGRPNWEFGDAAPGVSRHARRIVHAGPASAGARLGIRKITLRNSVLRYHSSADKPPVELSSMNLTLRWPDPAAAATLTGSFLMRGREILVEAGLETPLRAQTGEKAQLAVDLTSDVARLRFDGHVLRGPGERLVGRLQANSDAPGQVFALAGASAAPDIAAFSIEGQLAAQPGQARLSDMRAAIDNMAGRGELSVIEGDNRPKLSGRLDFDALDLDKLDLVPVPAQTDATMLQGGLWPAHAKADDAPRLRVQGLTALDADVSATAQTLTRRALSGRDAALRARIDNGLLRLDLSRLSLYGGRAKGQAEISEHDGVPVISTMLDVTDVSALPLFRDAASFDWVSGTLSGRINLASGGDTLDGLRQRLRGEARMRLRDGALEGLDLPGMIARLQDGDIDEMDRRAGDQTNFTQLEANWTIQTGVAKTSDLILEGPYVTAKGAGTVDIRRERMDMRLQPRVTARSSKRDSADGIEIPLQVKGRWDNPKIYPDVEAVLKNPEKSLGAAKNFGKAVEKLTGGKVSEDDFRGAIEGLLGGGKK